MISFMTAKARAILTEALELGADERTDIAVELLASLDGEPDADAEAAWAKEIAARAERARRGDSAGRDASEVHAEARRIIEGK
jgi:hypothetical protein